MPSFLENNEYECSIGEEGVDTSQGENGIRKLRGSDAADFTFRNEDIDENDRDTPLTDKLEAIAVVGFDLAFPQEATNPEAFWKMLIEARSALTDIPQDRFNLDGHFSPQKNRTGMLSTRGGHFLKNDIATFDAPFFSITPSEAACMDPQQRLLLESTYKALENAGITLDQIQGTATSVHVGSFMHDYEIMLARDPEFPGKYKATGTGDSILANRISWFFNLTGPSMTLDTACSSSMVALHLACQDIRSGHTKMGLVSGCNIILNPETLSGLEELNFLSPQGKCHSFDARANGYSRGEGVGTLVLKSVKEALRCNDTIRAVIRNTGCNQDGRTPGITQPSSQAQERLIRQTYADAGLKLDKTKYFESHGTGTALGDALEAQAINSVFGDATPPNCPLYVGAVKSNIGHLEGASGIAGVIKTILVLEKGVIPPNIWYEKPNPRIRTSEWNIAFPTRPVSWPGSGLRRASVSSFGYGGANGHVVLEDAANFLQLRRLTGCHCTHYDSFTAKDRANGLVRVTPNIDTTTKDSHSLDQTPKLLVWSSMDEGGLQRLAVAYDEWFADKIDGDANGSLLDDLAFTLAKKRTCLPWRSFITVNSISQLRPSLKFSSPTRATKAPTLCFVFTGQGAQWFAMGRELMRYPVYKNSLTDADRYFRSLGCEWSLLCELGSKDESDTRLSDPSFSQPICTALQLAIVDLVSSWEIRASVVVGHSSGEIAAAFAAGAISRESALRLAYYRGLVSASTARQSHHEAQGMLAVGLSAAEMTTILVRDQLDGNVVIAAVNSPRSVTLSGPLKFLDSIFARLKSEGVFSRHVLTNVAYHSMYMEDAAFLYARLVHNIQPGVDPFLGERPAMISTVTGTFVPHSKVLKVSYWVDNLIKPVQFFEAVSLVCARPSKTLGKARQATVTAISCDFFLEIGPHSTLKGPISETLQLCGRTKDIGYGSVLVRGKNAVFTAIDAAARLFCLGSPLNIIAVNGLTDDSRAPRMLTNLPSYPFNHTKRHWLESRVSRNFRFRQVPHHELLGTRHADWNDLEAVWSHRIVLSEKPWIEDHKVNGINVYPAAGVLVMAIEAARQVAETDAISGYRFRDVALRKALIVPSAAEGIEARFYLRPVKNVDAKMQSWSEFRLCVNEKGDWSETSRGAIAVESSVSSIDFMNTESAEQQSIEEDFAAGASRCTKTLPKMQLFKYFSELGLDYGNSFQSCGDIRFNYNGESTAVVNSRHWKGLYSMQTQPHIIHPTALDAVLQLCLLAVTRGGHVPVPTIVPTVIKNLWVSHEQIHGGNIGVYAQGDLTGLRNARASIIAVSSDSKSLRCTADVEMTAVSDGHGSHDREKRSQQQRFYNSKWDADVDFLANSELNSFCTASGCERTPSTDMIPEKKELFCALILGQVVRNVPEQALSAQPHIHKYWQWMQRQVASRTADHHPTVDLDVLWHDVKRSGHDGELLIRMAQNLEGVLKGQIDPLEMLFADKLLEKYYRLANNTPYTLSRATRYVDAMAHKNPGLKILEIGAGTGGLTSYIVDALTSPSGIQQKCVRFSEYMFTDLSPSFFGPAKERFNLDAMLFKSFDVEQDPELQGFELGRYDLILASMVLHATKSLKDSLIYTRKLLKPGGKLVFYESVSPHDLFSTFLFGVLPGWWRSLEINRQWGPLLTAADWHDILVETNFSGVDVALSKYEDERIEDQCALISTALPESRGETSSFPKIFLLVDKTSSLQTAVATQLEKRLKMLSCNDLGVLDFAGLMDVNLSEIACISLIDLEASLLSNLDEDRLKILQNITNTCESLLWLMHDGGDLQNSPESAMAYGFARTIRTEREGFKFVTLDFDCADSPADLIDPIVRVLRQMFDSTYDNCETEYAQREGRLCISRVTEAQDMRTFSSEDSDPQALELKHLSDIKDYRLQLAIRSVGLLDSLHFVKTSISRNNLSCDEIQIEVKAVGLNFRDLLVALGHIQSDHFGIECAGIITAVGDGCARNFAIGERVLCGFDNTFITSGRCAATSAVKLPDSMSYGTAAALPTIFCTAIYSLYHWARLKQGESVLIHSGAGGLGQALIQIAKLSHAEIFTTVGSQEKRDLLVNLYGIPEDHIFSSRTNSFAKAIKRMTQRRGVDVVVNSLAGEGLRSSWECIAPFGRFLEVGKKDIQATGVSPMGGLPMYQFSKNVMFASVDLVFIMEKDRELYGKLMQDVMDLARNNKIHAPQPLHVFRASEIVKAFRFMQSGTHAGKIVIEFDENQDIPVTPRPALELFSSDATYVIAGGLGGIGQSIASWMVSRNARNLIILSRSKTYPESTQIFLDNLRSRGVEVAVPPCDIADGNALSKALHECSRSMAPIKGCIQAAMALENALFSTMTADQWHKAVKPKVDGTWNLHKCLPSGMDFFIMLSSYAGIVGGVGQSNYAAGNTYQDALARLRISHGEKATAIDLGPVESVGVVANNQRLAAVLQAAGHKAMKESELHTLLEYYCDPSRPLASPPLSSQLITCLEIPAVLRAKNAAELPWMSRPMFRELQQIPADDDATSNNNNNNTASAEASSNQTSFTINIGTALSGADTTIEAEEIICSALREKLSAMLLVEKADIDPHSPLHTHGVDSLVAVELRNWFAKAVGADVAVFEILGNSSSAGDLAREVAKKSKWVPETVREEARE